MNLARLSILHIFFFLFVHGNSLSTDSLEYRLKKISISGVFTGKDIYKKLYHLTKGQVFDPEKHKDSIHAIEQHLKRNGYLLASVQTECLFDDTRKTVHVHIHIIPGNIFTINSVVCKGDQEKGSLQEIFKKLQRRLTRRLKKQYCTQEVLDAQARMMKAYFAKKGYLFADIEMEQLRDDEKATVAITFTCTLKHKKQFIFLGNTVFTSQELHAKCAEFGKALLIIPPDLIVQELKNSYHSRGYLDVAITCYDEAHSLMFDIQQGPQAFVEDIKIHGLADCVVTDNPYSFFKHIIKRPYDYSKMRKSLSHLMAYLVQQGYWKAHAQTDCVKQPSGKYVWEVTINLGEQLFISQIVGNDFQELLKLLYQQSWCKNYTPLLNNKSTVPRLVDMNIILRQRKFLQKQLHDSGYLYTQIVPQFLEEEDFLYLQWRFSGKKEPVRFGKTRIEGSCNVPDKIINRAITYQEGAIWNKKELDETATTLRNFGVFDQVTVFPENITQQEDSKTIIIQVQDADSFELRTRAGFQGVGTNLSWRGGATYKFGGTFLWKNPSNAADIFSLNIDFTRFFRYAMLMYQRAFLGQLPIRQQFKFYSNRYDQPVVLGSREILYRFAQDGFIWALSRDYAGAQWGVTTGMEWMQISDISRDLSQAIDFTMRFIDKRIPYFFCEPSLYMSNVDNRLDPLSGWYLLLSSKALAPFTVRDGASLKFLLEQGNYIPVHKKSHTVLAVRIRLGTIIYQQFSTIMPPERFYLGGAYSLRGYEPDLAPPLNFYRNDKQELIVVPTGGKTMVNGNFELRFTLFKSLGGTLFSDIGLLTQRAVTDIHAQDIIGATGFGLRWNTPVGPLRFDIGWKWKQFPGNVHFYDQAAYAWFLTLGNAF